MTLVYHFTSGVSADTPSTAWDATGRTDVHLVSKPTSRDGVFLAINEALQGASGAGWTAHVTSSTVGARDVVYFADGENNDQHNCIRITSDTSGRYINFYAGTKLDNSTPKLLQGAIGGGSTVRSRWDLSTSDTPDWELQILASEDFIWVFVQEDTVLSGDPVYSMFLGSPCPVDAQKSTLTATSLTAGDNVTITPAAGNPLTLGYRPGGILRIVEVDEASAAAAETQLITKVTSTTIEVRRLNNSYTSARIGDFPVRMFRYVGTNDDIESNAQLTSPLNYYQINGDDLDATVDANGQQIYDIHYSLLSTGTSTSEQGFGSGTTPNQATLRFVCRSLGIIDSNAALVGTLPSIYNYPGDPTYYPHSTDTFVRDRVTPTEDYTIARFTSTTGLDYVLGPTPT